MCKFFKALNQLPRDRFLSAAEIEALRNDDWEGLARLQEEKKDRHRRVDRVAQWTAGALGVIMVAVLGGAIAYGSGAHDQRMREFDRSMARIDVTSFCRQATEHAAKQPQQTIVPAATLEKCAPIVKRAEADRQARAMEQLVETGKKFDELLDKADF